MFATSSGDDRDPSLAELIRYSSQALLRKPLGRATPRDKHVISPASHTDANYLSPSNWQHEEPNPFCAVADTDEYAPPLMPLRERDMRMLADLFHSEVIHEIEADILKNLLNRYPEPCWEDDPFEFLREYL